MVVYGGKLPPARRLVVSGLSATAIVLGGNLFGVTSWLLSQDGGVLAERSRLDVLVPVNGLRRCLDRDNGFTFLYPARWLADQTLYRRYAQRVEQATALDPPPLRGGRRRNGGAPEPAAAYGPPGGSGEENISVVVAPIREGFTLQKMGAPQEAAQTFLQTTVAPEGSGKTATLLSAGARRDAKGELYYFVEFKVQSERPAFYRHNLAVYAARNGLLYSLNCQSSEARWAENEAGFRRAAESFTILNSGVATAGFPDRL